MRVRTAGGYRASSTDTPRHAAWSNQVGSGRGSCPPETGAPRRAGWRVPVTFAPRIDTPLHALPSAAGTRADRSPRPPQRRALTQALCADLADLADLADAPAVTAAADRLRRRLAELNMPVAETIASHYYRRGIAADDIRRVAHFALVKAALRFDPRRGAAFLPYAVPTIRGEIRRYIRDLRWIVRPPRAVQERQAAAIAGRSDPEATLGREPNNREIALEPGDDPAEVREALAAWRCFTPTSPGAPPDQDTGSPTGDRLGATDPAMSAAEAPATLAPARRALERRDRELLHLRLTEDLTQSEIATRMNTSQVQVSRHLARIIDNLRHALE